METQIAKPKLKDAGRLTEVALKSKYPHVVEGSLRWNGLHGKQEVSIQCVQEGCDATREVFTSDLFQIDSCKPCTVQSRKLRMKTRRAEAKAIKALLAPAVVA